MNTNCPNTCDTCPLSSTCSRERKPAPTGSGFAPSFTLQNRDGFWELTCDDRTAVLPQNHAWFFVAILLNQKAGQPLSVRELSRLVFATFGAHPDFIYGGAQWLRLHLEESELEQILKLREEALERLLDRDYELEIIKHEALRELQTVYALQDELPSLLLANNLDYARQLREALQAVYRALARATDRDGEPHPVLRPFAEHLHAHIIVPSLLSVDDSGNPQFVHAPGH